MYISKSSGYLRSSSRRSVTFNGARGFSGLQGHRILLTGAKGQLGIPLAQRLFKEVGNENVVVTDVNEVKANIDCQQEVLDVVDYKRFDELVKKNKITHIIHLAAILSALGERNPELGQKVNVNGTLNALNVAREQGCKIYVPSTIGVFGGELFPRQKTPDDCILMPKTIYGVTKVFTEHIGAYFHKKFGVDFRSLRYPGIISSEKYAFNGTTDYSTEVFFHALEQGKYKCFLKKDTYLPMMYIDASIEQTVQFLKVDDKNFTRRVYNVAGISFCPEELANAIKKLIPGFEISYEPDFRQAIADSWPQSIDDSDAQRDWGLKYDVTVEELAKQILNGIDPKYKQGKKLNV